MKWNKILYGIGKKEIMKCENKTNSYSKYSTYLMNGTRITFKQNYKYWKTYNFSENSLCVLYNQ